MIPKSMNTTSLPALRDRINEKVIGQAELVSAVTGMIYRHYIKMIAYEDASFPRSPTTLLIMGNTGTGKTMVVQETLEKLGLSFIKIDGKRISPEGWTGLQFDKLIEEGFVQVQHDTHRLFPVVFVDEFDKAIRPHLGTTASNYHEQLQSSILKYIDGVKLSVTKVEVDTSNFCFIFAGAFAGLFDEEKGDIGFSSVEKEQKQLKDLALEYGMIPELAGRINKFVKSNDFSRNMYRDMLCNEHFIFNRWVSYLKKAGYTKLGSPNYTLMIEQAYDKKLGARGMIQLLDEELQSLMELVNLGELHKNTPKKENPECFR